MKLLLVEDDDDLAAALGRALEEAGYAVDRVGDGDLGLYRAREWEYDGIILDLMLPGIDGRTLLRRLRRERDTPVLVLTARDRLDDRVGGLDEGADDYLTKPFELDELLARVRALLRRSQDRRGGTVVVGELKVDLRNRTARIGEEPVELTHHEYVLLEALVLNRGRVVPRRALEDRLESAARGRTSNTLEVLVSRLRRKIGPDLIATRRRIGYGIVTSER